MAIKRRKTAFIGQFGSRIMTSNYQKSKGIVEYVSQRHFILLGRKDFDDDDDNNNNNNDGNNNKGFQCNEKNALNVKQFSFFQADKQLGN